MARKTFGHELVWAVEHCRHVSARLKRDLLTDGQAVVRVPPQMMAEQRRIARYRCASLCRAGLARDARQEALVRSTRLLTPVGLGPRAANRVNSPFVLSSASREAGGTIGGALRVCDLTPA